MNYLIRWLGALLTRHIERGSKIGAIFGAAMVGIGTGVVAFLFLKSHDNAWTGRYEAFWAAAVGLVGALLGAMVGSRWIAPLALAPNPIVRRARIYRWNETTPKLIFSIGLLALTCILPFLKDDPKKDPMPMYQKALFVAGTFTGSIVMAVLFAREVICIDVSDRIFVTRPIGSLDITDDADYTILLRPSGEAGDNRSHFLIQRNGRILVDSRLSPPRAAELAVLLGKIAERT